MLRKVASNRKGENTFKNRPVRGVGNRATQLDAKTDTEDPDWEIAVRSFPTPLAAPIFSVPLFSNVRIFSRRTPIQRVPLHNRQKSAGVCQQRSRRPTSSSKTPPKWRRLPSAGAISGVANPPWHENRLGNAISLRPVEFAENRALGVVGACCEDVGIRTFTSLSF